MTDIVGPVKSKPQTTRAKWRGLIRVTRARGGLFTAEARHGEIDALMVGDYYDLDAILGDRRRAYFKATVLGDGTLMIRGEVGRKRYYTEDT